MPTLFLKQSARVCVRARARVCRQPSPCQSTHGEVMGTGSLWASNHEINMDGPE